MRPSSQVPLESLIQIIWHCFDALKVLACAKHQVFDLSSKAGRGLVKPEVLRSLPPCPGRKMLWTWQSS